MEQKPLPVKDRNRVAVIGLGLHGVTITKNLIEHGFHVVGFDQNEYIGGLWKYSTSPNQTTVLRTTKANVSKQRNAFPDFPFPDDAPDYPTGEQVAAYIDSYAAHFNLAPSFRLGVKIVHLDRANDDTHWVLQIEEKGISTTEVFDRVVVTTGAHEAISMPHVEGQEEFSGQIMHAQAFKDPSEFTGKRVLVVGVAHTGCDIAVDLTGIAEKVYISHRSGTRIWSRIRSNGTILDHGAGRRLNSLGLVLNSHFPVFASKLAEKVIEREMRAIAGGSLRPEWRLLPAPSIRNILPIVNDTVLKRFADGSILPVTGLKRFLSSTSTLGQTASSVELTDGTILNSIDTVIFSTGYNSSYSILGPTADPTVLPTPELDAAPYSHGEPFPRLYQGLLSTVHPQSLAFVGPYASHSIGAFLNLDLSGQAIGRIWAGYFPLPPQAEMDAWCDAVYRKMVADANRWRVPKPKTDSRELEQWLNEAAGNRVNEMLGWGVEGWKFWWRDREICKLALWGIDTPFVYRLFEPNEGGRKAWSGAREAILKANKKI